MRTIFNDYYFVSFSPVIYLHLDGSGTVGHDLVDLVLFGLLLLLLGIGVEAVILVIEGTSTAPVS